MTAINDPLAPYNDKLVEVEGLVDTFQFHVARFGLPIRTMLAQDCCILLDNGESVDIGHTWVQHVGDFEAGLKPPRYSRIKFVARLRRYKKGGVEDKWGLTCPRNGEIIGNPTAYAIPAEVRVEAPAPPSPPVVHAPPVEPAKSPVADPFVILKDLKALVTRAGGWERFDEMASLMR